MNYKSKPFVSVIIPVYNDVERLKTCLESLEKQTYPKDKYEIIVVDNGLNKNIKSITKKFDNTILTKERYPGTYAARNKGISIAKGKILAFTDSDCIPAKDWIEKGVNKILNESNCGLVAGKIKIFPKNIKKLNAVELFEILTAFPQERYIKKLYFGATANVFTLKSVINKVGFLDGTLKSGGDLEWGQRVAAAGYKQVYADDVIVAHPARFSLYQIYKKHSRVIDGLYDMQMKKGEYSIKKFLIDLKDDWPHLEDFLNIFKDKKLKNFEERIKVFLVMLFVKNVRILERIRLYFRGKTERW